MARSITHMSLEGGVLFFEDGTEVSGVSVEMIKALPALVKSLGKCANHVGHYGSMQHAHSDAHRDAADARGVLKQAAGDQNHDGEGGDKRYTVIGFYTDTQLRYVTHCDAGSPEGATEYVAELYPDESISIVAVIAGHHMDLLEGDYPEDTDDTRERIQENKNQRSQL